MLLHIPSLTFHKDRSSLLIDTHSPMWGLNHFGSTCKAWSSSRPRMHKKECQQEKDGIKTREFLIWFQAITPNVLNKAIPSQIASLWKPHHILRPIIVFLDQVYLRAQRGFSTDYIHYLALLQCRLGLRMNPGFILTSQVNQKREWVRNESMW